MNGAPFGCSSAPSAHGGGGERLSSFPAGAAGTAAPSPRHTRTPRGAGHRGKRVVPTESPGRRVRASPQTPISPRTPSTQRQGRVWRTQAQTQPPGGREASPSSSGAPGNGVSEGQSEQQGRGSRGSGGCEVQDALVQDPRGWNRRREHWPSVHPPDGGAGTAPSPTPGL